MNILRTLMLCIFCSVFSNSSFAENIVNSLKEEPLSVMDFGVYLLSKKADVISEQFTKEFDWRFGNGDVRYKNNEQKLRIGIHLIEPRDKQNLSYAFCRKVLERTAMFFGDNSMNHPKSHEYFNVLKQGGGLMNYFTSMNFDSHKQQVVIEMLENLTYFEIVLFGKRPISCRKKYDDPNIAQE